MSRKRQHVPLSREPQGAVIDGFTHGGEGVARIEGKAVFVPGAIPGERVVLRVTDDRARWARAEVVEVVDPSPDRVPTPVPDPADWGGCDLLHIAPGAARELKTRVVHEQLARLGKVDDAPVEPCRAVGPDRHYRNHVQLHAADDGTLGFHRAGSHDVVPAERCPVMTDAVQQVLDQVGADTGASRVVVRAHPSTGTAAVVITPGPGGLELPGGEFDLLLEQPDGSTITMRGDGVLAEQVAGITYRFDASSFFQVTTDGAAALVDTVLDACGDVSGALVWDLYAGVGLLSLPLARAGADVVAVEGHEPAARWAERNADDAGVPLEVLAEPVVQVVRRAVASDTAQPSDGVAEHATAPPSRPFPPSAGATSPTAASPTAASPTAGRPSPSPRPLPLDPPDVVVLDPPRVGAGEDVVAGLVDLAPATIVYVACDVAALARDTRHLVDGGYRLTRAVPLDLFPLTHHVEVVATFTR